MAGSFVLGSGVQHQLHTAGSSSSLLCLPTAWTHCAREISPGSHLGRRVRSIPCGRRVVGGTGQSLGALPLPKTFSASASCLLHTLMRQSQK